MQRPDRGAQRAQTAQPAQTAGANRASQLAALEARRSELKSQLQSLTERRMMLQVSQGSAEGAAKVALVERLKAIDDRIGRIDDELNTIDDQVSSSLARGEAAAPSALGQLIQGTLLQPPAPPAPFSGFDRGALRDGIVSVVLTQVLGFVVIALLVRRWLRRAPGGATRLAPEDAARLDQLQRSVDVMAVEIERISEAQRYVAKSIGGGAAEPVPVRNREGEVMGRSTEDRR